MGSSFVEFRGYGFWARDLDLQCWLYHNVLAMDAHPKDEWSKGLRQCWWEQAHLAGTGCVNPALDRFIETEGHRQRVLRICEEAVPLLEAKGDRLSMELLAEFRGDPMWPDETLDLRPVRRVAKAFIQLLNGEIRTTPSDSSIVGYEAPEGMNVWIDKTIRLIRGCFFRGRVVVVVHDDEDWEQIAELQRQGIPVHVAGQPLRLWELRRRSVFIVLLSLLLLLLTILWFLLS